jgi:hypothetical protein
VVYLLCLGCAHGASAFTSATLNAQISVDLVLVVAFLDCLNGALFYTSAARNASIGNFVSHDQYLRKNIVCLIVAYFLQKARAFLKKIK